MVTGRGVCGRFWGDLTLSHVLIPDPSVDLHPETISNTWLSQEDTSFLEQNGESPSLPTHPVTSLD